MHALWKWRRRNSLNAPGKASTGIELHTPYSSLFIVESPRVWAALCTASVQPFRRTDPRETPLPLSPGLGTPRRCLAPPNQDRGAAAPHLGVAALLDHATVRYMRQS